MSASATKTRLGIAIVLAASLAGAASTQAAPKGLSEDAYRQTLRRVFLISNSPYVRLLPMGRSVGGRAVPALVISDFRGAIGSKTRVFICAGQHGDETAPVKAMLSLSARLASGRNPDVLAKCVVIVAPMVNPDGLVRRHRLNAAGMDLNRDWTAASAPETRFIAGLIAVWKPHVLLDMHEWLDSSPAHGDAIEAAMCRSNARETATALIAREAGHASGLELIWSGRNTDQRLFHRRYSSLGYTAYLVETAPDASPVAKHLAYVNTAMSVIQSACSATERWAEVSPASTAFRQSQVASLLGPVSPRPAISDSALWAGIIVLGVCVLLVFVKPSASTNGGEWSRRFRKCDLQDVVPSSTAHGSRKQAALVPITARSWVRRRTRTRYSRGEA